MKMPLRDKVLVVIIIFLLGALWGLKAVAAMPDDVMDAKQISQVVPCQTPSGIKHCALFEKEGKHYRLAVDELGVYTIHQVTLIDLGGKWRVGDPVLLYERGSGI